jgi:thimet oligopeptidase
LNIHPLAIVLAGLLWVTTSGAETPKPTKITMSTAVDGWDFNLPATKLTALCDKTIAEARIAFTAIEQDEAQATLQRVYGAYDAMSINLQAIQQVWYVSAVHPDLKIQAAAEECINQISDFSAAIELSPQFYERLASIDLQNASDPERLMVEKKLIAFRKAGVDQDQAVRDKVRALMAEITELGNEFDKNIRTDKRTVDATPDQLAGLPQDYLDAHPANEKGIVSISTDYPDYFPVLKYGTNDDLRRQLFVAAKSIATPANSSILKTLIAKRHELAILLNYDSYAALAMDGLMATSPQTVDTFLKELGAAVKTPAAKDMETLLTRLRQIDPKALQVEAWQVDYLSNLLQQEVFALDAREIRTYFPFDKVQTGIFQLTETMFGVEIVPWQTETWHPDVTAWEIREQGKPLGRFYLDMHPRENKYRHAAHWTLRTGLKDGQLPMSGMAMNFPEGLMEHRQVETFLHEFGHLLHNMFSGTQRWLDISGMTMERDFVEAPSQMLEDWAWDYDTLREFAINDKGQPISEELVGRMNSARHFGEAAKTAGQLFYANLSLNYYNRDPDSFQLLPLLIELQAQYSPFPYAEGTHFYNNFGHLNGYSSNYYIYQWSQAIAVDLLSRFSDGLRNPAIAQAYREKVLAPAGSKPASELVKDFLGRPFTLSTYITYLDDLN